MKGRDVAWILILIVDGAYIAWGGAMAAASPDHLLRGPGGKPILAAAYEGYRRTRP